jgi:hypothetical protein
MAKSYFASESGSDGNPGTIDSPFRTIAKGISVLQAGDVLNLREGAYAEAVVVEDKHGSAGSNIVIRSFPGEHARLDGCVDQFRTAPNRDWKPASLVDADAHPDEFVSVAPITPDSKEDFVNRGAFLDREPYTRLISYSRLEDLRADNQTFDQLKLDDPRPGPEETDGAGKPRGFRRPWVYMGPGVFFDQGSGRVHIRLSHTANNIVGLADYDGPTDPGAVGLAISHKIRPTLVVRNSSFVRFEDLSLRFGGEHTVDIRRTLGVVFDHVRLRASTDGVFLGDGNTGTVFRHCEIDGGLPTWCFRSDLKDEYHFKVGEKVVTNGLGANTSGKLMHGHKDNTNLEIHHCEFVNAHDLYLFGHGLDFHHNWLHNLNDEAMFLDAVESDNVRIHHNVIARCLSAISFAGNLVGGQVAIYRNLIDLRRPTAGYRPRNPGETKVFRFGHLYKSNGVDGPLALFRNTCLVLGSGSAGQASYTHYRNADGPHARRSFNNIFIAVNPDSDSDQSITIVPPPSFPGPTDGNCYFRFGAAGKPLLRFLGYAFGNQNFRAGTFLGLAELKKSELFRQSMGQYPPGFEAHSIDVEPLFRLIAADGNPQETDDLRLQPKSPARKHGVDLPADLAAFDPGVSPSASRDIGCFPFGSTELEVGVDGRRQFPATKP